MGARQKLNVAAMNGSLIIAALAGIVFKSWEVFIVVAVILVAGGVHTSDIRTRPRYR